MPSELTPLTELEAVNEMLGVGSESPVSTLDDNEVIDASLALSLLRTTSVEIQTRGWYFNEEEGVTLSPNTAGEIILPRNLLRLDTSGASASTEAVQRGTRLYNRVDRSYQFPDGVTVDWTLALPFEELPSSARLYITIRAARKFQDRYFGDPSMHSYAAQDEQIAHVSLKDEDLEYRDPSMLSSTFATNLTSRV